MMWILSVQIIPPMLLAIPYFLLSVAYDIYDTYIALVVTYASFSLPFATLMLRSYFSTIPRELEEAAIVDGCGRLGALVRIVLPVSLPGIVATGVYTFVLAWNELLFALTLTEGWRRRTIPVSIGFLMGEFTSEWNQIMALSVLGSVPVIVIFIFLQRHLVQGMTAGAMKG
jgi:multiple sugar transport system permease protein